jgi:hypothetical protein
MRVHKLRLNNNILSINNGFAYCVMDSQTLSSMNQWDLKKNIYGQYLLCGYKNGTECYRQSVSRCKCCIYKSL